LETIVTTLIDLFPNYATVTGGGDKGSLHSYIEVYQKQMRRRKNIDLLEIGVWEGHSLAMWQEYFSGSRIVGIDIDLSRCRFPVDARRCDATNPGELQIALGDATFDYIVDDGSHRVADQIASFHHLWDRVKPGGKYFIEDVQSDQALALLADTMSGLGVNAQTFDLRNQKGRYDDILIVINK
jgi:SAM-dependent methyltransferase